MWPPAVPHTTDIDMQIDNAEGVRQYGTMDHLPKRKQIRLAGYDYSQNNAYFITICTHGRARLFGESVRPAPHDRSNDPRKMMERWLSELENKYPHVQIDKYVIMPDHLHLILRQTGDHTGSPLPKIMAWFKTMTTNEYICGVKQGLLPPFDKHVWQRGYHEHIIRNQDDYDEVWQYIDENPLKRP